MFSLASIKFCFLGVALFTLFVTGTPIAGRHLQSDDNTANRIIVGNLTERSVLVHSADVDELSYFYSGPNVISYIEIVNRNDNANFDQVRIIRNGLGSNSILISANGVMMSISVNIYAAPWDFTFGTKSDISVLEYS